MIQWKCVFCGVDFEFATCRHKGAHITNCKMNPKRASTLQKLQEIGAASRVERIEIVRECERCGKAFTQTRTQAEINSGKNVLLTCSLACGKSRDWTDERKEKHSAIMTTGYADGSIKHATWDKPSGFYTGLRGRSKVREIRSCPICSATFECVPSSNKTTCAAKECTSKLLSIRLTGKTGGYRTQSGTSKFRGSYYDGAWMDSSWEVRMAQRLDDLHIEWSRELTFFEYVDLDGKTRKYYPDFYLPTEDTYIEVKGYWTDKVRHKMKSVQEMNSFRLIILDDLKSIDSFDINQL